MSYQHKDRGRLTYYSTFWNAERLTSWGMAIHSTHLITKPRKTMPQHQEATGPNENKPRSASSFRSYIHANYKTRDYGRMRVYGEEGLVSCYSLPSRNSRIRRLWRSLRD